MVDPSKVLIGSMDAVGLYPSLKINETLAILEIMIMESEITFERVEWCELAKYLKIVCTQNELDEADLTKYMPDRYSTRGPKPTLRYLLVNTVKINKNKDPIISFLSI